MIVYASPICVSRDVAVSFLKEAQAKFIGDGGSKTWFRGRFSRSLALGKFSRGRVAGFMQGQRLDEDDVVVL